MVPHAELLLERIQLMMNHCERSGSNPSKIDIYQYPQSSEARTSI